MELIFFLSMSVVHGVVFFHICEVGELVTHPYGDLVREKSRKVSKLCYILATC
jgi:hypothetical protein